MNHHEKLIVALDVPDFSQAQNLVKILSPLVRMFKVGQELFTAEGPRIIEMVHQHESKVFLDLKFHDIPNTVASACASAAKLGVFMMNVHAIGGREMMTQAAKKAPLIIAVTVLTSLKEEDLNEVGISKKLKDQVRDLALLAKDCGLKGIVASPHEIEIIRESTGKDFLIVTPGVRPSWASTHDQKRVMTPKEAMSLGADFIVIGRPITQDPDPLKAAQRVLEEMSS